MMSVKRFVISSGERFAVLIDGNNFPMTYPNLYSVIYLRNRGQSINTIVAVLEDIKLLYLLLDKLEIDIEQRVKNQNFLKLNEIESVVNLANFKRHYLLNQKSQKKILSFPRALRKEAVRSKFLLKHDDVSKDLVYRRLTNFAEYLGWLESYFHSSCTTITNKAFKARRPQESIDESMDYKSFDQEQLKIILNQIDPKSHKCIWTSDFLNYRNELIIYLFLYLGCRKGELLNIKLSDLVNKKAKLEETELSESVRKKEGTSYITIRRNHDDKSDSRLYQPLVKTRSRSLALNLNLKKKIDEYILKYRSAIPNAELSDFLILSVQGRPLSINALNKIFAQISEKVSFNVHAHAFRHTWNDKYTDKSLALVASGKTTEDKAENDRAYLMGWIPGSQSARRYAKRAENRRAMEVGMEIQKKFEEDNG